MAKLTVINVFKNLHKYVHCAAWVQFSLIKTRPDEAGTAACRLL